MPAVAAVEVVVSVYWWPTGEIVAVTHVRGHRPTMEVVGDWVTGEVWGRGGEL